MLCGYEKNPACVSERHFIMILWGGSTIFREKDAEFGSSFSVIYSTLNSSSSLYTGVRVWELFSSFQMECNIYACKETAVGK